MVQLLYNVLIVIKITENLHFEYENYPYIRTVYENTFAKFNHK